ncbi:MAG: asd [Chloroflexi bacterium]|nr:asd [Chloroflexota bacterium]
MPRKINIAVLGATGLVGRTFLRILEERHFPVGELRALASERSEGKLVPFGAGEIPVHAVREDSFDGADFALIAVDDSVSREWAPKAARAGAVVVDKSGAWRMDPSVPLVVPEVNPDDAFEHDGIIAGPNCSTIQLVVALAPIHRVNPITRIIVDSYQAVSGTGSAAVEELKAQNRAIVKGEHYEIDVYPHQIALNVLPHIGSFSDNGYCSEEIKLVNETRKILHSPDMAISATTVRVPVEVGHSEAVHIELTHPMTAAEVRDLLRAAPGVAVVDDPSGSQYPLPLDAAGRDEVFVGRIRNDISHPHGIAMWIVSDNLRKGAALNAVQVAELLMARGALPSKQRG